MHTFSNLLPRPWGYQFLWLWLDFQRPPHFTAKQSCFHRVETGLYVYCFGGASFLKLYVGARDQIIFAEVQEGACAPISPLCI